jgi:hypothetical protein
MLTEEVDEHPLRYENARLRAALEVVLLYLSPSPWDEAKSKRWEREVGQVEATTAILCGHIRSTLAAVRKPS